MIKTKIKDIIGDTYNNLTIVSEDKESSLKQKRTRVICKCCCGNKKSVFLSNLKSGAVKSCGCISKKRLTTHGCSETRIYRIYKKIVQRCNNKNDKSFKYYGGRGIKISKEWENDFLNFKSWAFNNGYNDTLSIERIDVNKGYNKDNCTWIPFAEQSYNHRLRKDNKTGYRGVYLTSSGKFSSIIRNNGKQKYLGVYNEAEDAHNARVKYINENNLKNKY